PDLASSAVEEAIRFESPVQIAFRTPRETVEIEDVTLPAGEPVPIFIGACNRDPSVFERPDLYDAARQPNPHLGFIAGPHFCLGAPLARAEAPVAVRMPLERFPRPKPAGEPQWVGSMPIRLLGRLDVSW